MKTLLIVTGCLLAAFLIFLVSWISADSLKIDGPDRVTWELKRATEDVRIDLESPKPAA